MKCLGKMIFEENVIFRIKSGRSCVVNLREKFSPGSGFEPVSPALRAGDPRSNPGPGEISFFS